VHYGLYQYCSEYTVPIPEKFKTIDIIAVTILTDIGAVRYITVYRPPEFNKIRRDYMVLLVGCLEYLCDTCDIVVLVGDFNLPHVDWNLLNSPDDDIQSAFLQFCVHYGLYQFVDVPTRDDHILDLVLSSDHNIMSKLQVAETFSTSDHCKVEFSLILGHDGNCTSPPAAVYYDYERADYDSIVSHLLNDFFIMSKVRSR